MSPFPLFFLHSSFLTSYVLAGITMGIPAKKKEQRAAHKEFSNLHLATKQPPGLV
jgi:hypothetical protein